MKEFIWRSDRDFSKTKEIGVNVVEEFGRTHLYWKKDKSWYVENDEPYWGVVLTKEAPEKARQSFEKWKEVVIKFDPELLEKESPIIPMIEACDFM